MVRDSDLKEQIGRHVHFDLVDFDKIYSFRASKSMSFNDVKVIPGTYGLLCDVLNYMLSLLLLLL